MATIGTQSQRTAVQNLTDEGWTKVGRVSRRRRANHAHQPLKVRMTDPTGAERKVWIGSKGKVLIDGQAVAQSV